MTQPVLTNVKKSTILIVNEAAETVTLSLDYIKMRHDQAVAEAQFWRKLMGLEPLPTGAMQRRTAKQVNR